jgi:protein-S-isoprenylcysteine O-methyltransferase Ste14
MNYFDYFEIATIVIFLLVVVSRVVYMRVSRNINPIAIGGGKKGLALVVELVSFAGLIVWMAEVLLRAFHSGFSVFPSSLHLQLIDSPVAKLLGVACATVGLVIFIMAYISFGDSWRVGFDVKTPGALVTSGMFAISRNPIYVFLDLWFLGIFLINGTLFFLIFAVLAILLTHWQILQEEAFLLNLYGQPYDDYRARTPRYFGW